MIEYEKKARINCLEILVSKTDAKQQSAIKVINFLSKAETVYFAQAVPNLSVALAKKQLTGGLTLKLYLPVDN